MVNKNSRINLITIILVVFITMVSAITVIAAPNTEYKLFHSKSLERMIQSATFTNAFLFMLGEELPQFTGSFGNKLDTPSIPNLAFEAATGIDTNNIESLLLREIPGFDTAHTKIHIAGEGSDYSNLPQESPPPDFDKLLEEDSDKDTSTDSNKETDQNSKIGNSANASVFIYHSHSWEGYLPLINDENVKPSDASSTDNNKNVVLVGSMLTEKFNAAGIKTVHNDVNTVKALRDKGWDYHHSYALSREQVEAVVSQNKNMQYFIDIHRDSARKKSTTKTIKGKSYAKLYFVVGKEHKNYEQNLLFAEEIHEKLQEKYPGLSKGIYLKSKAEGNGVYNQDLSNKSLLIEVGGIDNNKEELNNTVEAFAEVFQEIYTGAIEVDAR